MIMRRLTAIWDGLIEPAWTGDAGDRQPSRILNIILLLLLLMAKPLGKNRIQAANTSDKIQNR
jgi:hypothetical protein